MTACGALGIRLFSLTQCVLLPLRRPVPSTREKGGSQLNSESVFTVLCSWQLTVGVFSLCFVLLVFSWKTIELKDVETHEQYEFLLNEIEIMKKLDHPNIVRSVILHSFVSHTVGHKPCLAPQMFDAVSF